jgi:acyl-CoA synthetase (NDP forming)
MASAIDPKDAATLRDAGAPVLEGTSTGLRAFRHLIAYRDFRARRRADPPQVEPLRRARWAEVLERGFPPSEAEALKMLSEYGVRVVRAIEAGDRQSAVRAARAIGYPVALKTAEGQAHKARAGGVALGLEGDEAVTAAYTRLSATLGPRVTVAEMVPAGVELAMGIVRDPQFGPLVMVGAGGVLVEVLADRRFALPPLDEESARRMIGELRAYELLVSGNYDIDAAARSLVAVGKLAYELGDALDALDVNPVIVSREGATAVDALVIVRASAVRRA